MCRVRFCFFPHRTENAGTWFCRGSRDGDVPRERGEGGQWHEKGASCGFRLSVDVSQCHHGFSLSKYLPALRNGGATKIGTVGTEAGGQEDDRPQPSSSALGATLKRGGAGLCEVKSQHGDGRRTRALEFASPLGGRRERHKSAGPGRPAAPTRSARGQHYEAGLDQPPQHTVCGGRAQPIGGGKRDEWGVVSRYGLCVIAGSETRTISRSSLSARRGSVPHSHSEEEAEGDGQKI